MRHLVLVLALALGAALAVPARADPVNLVLNGNFEAGRNEFFSGYTYSPTSNTQEQQYTVARNPYPWNVDFVNVGDHTTGKGLMLVANGAPDQNQVVWRSTPIAVDRGARYFFEAFVSNVCCQGFNYGPGSESVLAFAVSMNGGPPQTLDVITTDLLLAGTWEGLSTRYVAPEAGSVVLSLVNRNVQRLGNDFALDDVFFGTESIVHPASAPGTLLLAGAGLIGGALSRRRGQLAA